MLRGCLSVSAYTDINGYPFVLDDMDASIYVYQDGHYDYGFKIAGQLQEQNSYLFDNTQANNVDGIKNISFGNLSSSFVVPFNTDVYDYYVVGTIAYTNSSSNDFGEIKNVNFYSETSSGNHWVNTYGLDTMLFENYSKVFGQSFYSKLGDIVTSNISSMMITFDEYSVLSAGSDIWFSASIVPVEKSAGTDAATAAIIQKLTEINTNQTNSNVLQQESNQIAQDTQNQIIQGNEIAQDQLEVEQEQANTQKSLLERITDFFGSFFENLINAIIGLFVPGEEEMAELFNQLNDFFADKFGFLYYPFELLTKVFNVLMTDSTTTAMTFPGITVLGYELCPAMEIDIAQNELVGDIFGHIRMLTGGTMCFAFVNYLRTKFDKTVKS